VAKTPTDIRSLARSHTETALKVLSGIMKEDKAPPAARVAAAQALLDRGWGKSVQHIETTRRTVQSMSDDELANIAAGSSEGAAEAPIDPSQLN
jgi:hypothetical protein